MATVPSEILDSFYAKLAESDALDEEVIEALRRLFESGRKVKADDFVDIFSTATKERGA